MNREFDLQYISYICMDIVIFQKYFVGKVQIFVIFRKELFLFYFEVRKQVQRGYGLFEFVFVVFCLFCCFFDNFVLFFFQDSLYQYGVGYQVEVVSGGVDFIGYVVYVGCGCELYFGVLVRVCGVFDRFVGLLGIIGYGCGDVG